MLSPGGLLLRLFGISCPPLDGLCWDSPESSLSQRLQPPQTRGGNLAALSLCRIPAGRNSWNCWWCLFSRGRQGSFVLVSSALPVSVADTSRVPCTTPVLLAAAVAELKAGGGSASYTMLQKNQQGPGISKQNAATATAAAFSLQFHSICITKPGNFNDKVLRCHQVFLELIKPLQDISRNVLVSNFCIH